MFEATGERFLPRCSSEALFCAARAEPRVDMRRYGAIEDGVSVLEYVLLVALVAMVATGTLLYLGRGSGSPSHVANNVGDNVAVGTSPGSRKRSG